MTDNETIDDTSGQLSLLKRLAHGFLRVILWLIVIAAVIGALVYLYYMYQEHKELTYMTSDECSRHDYKTQICETDNGSLYLRRIEIDKNRMSIVAIVDDAAWDSYKYNYRAFWFERCEEGVEIATDMSFSSGEPIMLVCNTQPNKYLSKSSPSRLEINIVFKGTPSVNFDSNGFAINHDYSNTDYSALLRRYALTATDVKKDRELRLKKEAEEENARLEKEAKEEKSRLDKRKLARQTAAAKRDNCNANNERKKNDFDRAISRARKIMLGESHISNYCETRHAEYSNWCMRYSFSIANKTKFPIKNVLVGYDNFKRCAEKPAQRLTFDATISQHSSSHKLVKFFNTDGEMCTRILDVTFDAAFMPKAC